MTTYFMPELPDEYYWDLRKDGEFSPTMLQLSLKKKRFLIPDKEVEYSFIETRYHETPAAVTLYIIATAEKLLKRSRPKLTETKIVIFPLVGGSVKIDDNLTILE